MSWINRQIDNEFRMLTYHLKFNIQLFVNIIIFSVFETLYSYFKMKNDYICCRCENIVSNIYPSLLTWRILKLLDQLFKSNSRDILNSELRAALKRRCFHGTWKIDFNYSFIFMTSRIKHYLQECFQRNYICLSGNIETFSCFV